MAKRGYIDLKDFRGFNITVKKKDLQQAVKNSGEYMQHKVSSYSPVGKNHRAYKYNRTWTTMFTAKKLESVVWNKENYRLTHLLENGHLNTNVKGGIGWVAPRPHIRPAFDDSKNVFEYEMKKVGADVKFK